MDNRSHIHTLTNNIINCEKDAHGKLYTVCNELYNALVKLTETDPNQQENRKDIALEQGNALGLIWAAMCIQDFMRTKRYLDGIVACTKDFVAKKAGKPVHILYAGTGPFATLVLPLTAIFSSDEIQFTFIDINENSLDCVKKTFHLLELDDYIHNIELADATTWKVPQGESIDIFISETMQRTLRKEPQVAICMNIVPQLPADAVMIPEQIILSAALINGSQRQVEKMENKPVESIFKLDTIYTLNKEEILKHTEAYQKNTEATYTFDETIVEIPADKRDQGLSLEILTDIQVYKEDWLLLDESQLTMPLAIKKFEALQPEKIRFQYTTGVMPEVKHTFEGVLAEETI